MQTAFVVNKRDNVCTAMTPVQPWPVALTGEGRGITITAMEQVAMGHKLSLTDIQQGQPIIKYGVEIGEATSYIPAGTWVHLHCIKSLVDRRSSDLDVYTGAPSDISYE